MTNINPIQVFTGINDTPIEATALEGCNGSAVVTRINKLIARHNKPIESQPGCEEIFALWVDTVDGLNTNNGLTNTTPFKDLQKALDSLEGKSIDDCYNLFIYVKGTVVGELDFTNLHSWYMSSSWSGAITLDKWPAETNKWIYEPGRYENIDDYVYQGSWYSGIDRGLYLDIYNCQFDVYTVVNFTNLSLGFSDCEFNDKDSYVGDVYSAQVTFYNCLSVYFYSVAITQTSKMFTITLDRTRLVVIASIEYTKTASTLFRLKLKHNSTLQLGLERLHTLYATQVCTIEGEPDCFIYALQEDSYKLEGINAVDFLGLIRFGKVSEVFSHQVYIPAPVDGVYVVAIPYKPCLLKNIAFSAIGGSLTVEPSPANSPISEELTFTGVSNVFWIEDIDYIIPYARAFAVTVELIDVTSVTGLFIQANFFPLNS